jgi:hypothetical protein
MTDSPECNAQDADLPKIIEEGENPGWQIRVGVSRREVEILAEADRQGIWFDTEDEMDAYVQQMLGSQKR